MIERFTLKLITLFFILFLNILFLNISYSQTENKCINYLPGEFEVYYDGINLSKIIGNNNNYNPPIPNCNYILYDYKGNIAIDRNIKYQGDGSLKIELFKDAGITSNYPFFQCVQRYNSLPDRDNMNRIIINPLVRNYYPNIGDMINIKFKLRSEILENAYIYFKLSYSTHSLATSSPSKVLINQLIASSTSANNWLDFFFNINIPQEDLSVSELRYLTPMFYFRPIDNSQPVKIKIYIDNLEIYAYYNNRCKSWPNKKESSLKFVEMFNYTPSSGLGSNDDFIYMYIENNAWLGGNINSILKIRQYDKNFKYFPYISLLTLHRYLLSTNLNDGFSYYLLKPRRSGGEFNNYLDDLNVNINTTSISDEYGSATLKIHPTARYPDYFLFDLVLNNTYKRVDNHPYYVITKTILNEKPLDYYIKSLQNIIRFLFGNSLYRPEIFFFDNYVMSFSNYQSRQYSNNNTINFYFSVFSKNIFEKLNNYFKFFGNLGYSPYIEEENVLASGNHYNVRNFINGYLDEGWLLRPDSNLTYYGPIRAHKLFKTVIENKNFDIILIIGAYLYPHCTSTFSTTTFMISSFYLVNNPNVYFALRPVGQVSGYGVSQCYDSSFYLSLGQPLPVNNIEELVIASTTNYQNGALYRRRYEKGLVLLNTSDRLTFTYTLSSTTEPFTNYKDHLGNNYIFNNNSINLEISPRSGLILYNPNP